MVKTCCVFTCPSESYGGCNISFHGFPKHEEMRQKWLSNIYVKQRITKNSVVCSCHFESSCFYTANSRQLLKPNAIPTIPTVLALNQADRGAKEQPSTADELHHKASTSTAEKLRFQPSTAEELKCQPSTSMHKELPSRYSMASGNENVALEEIILIKEDLIDEEKNQCRLCLSVGRRMRKLGEYAALYRKLLFENYQNTTIPRFMHQMLACWECFAELRRVERFQYKVRRANNAFETHQNRNCETLSNLSTILIGEYNKSEEDEREKLSRVEECAQGIKEETVEVEQEETSMPDPLEFNQEDRKAGWDSENLEIQNEPKQKAMKRTKPELEIARDVPKRAKLGQTVTSGPKRLELDQSSPKTSKEQENNPKFTADTDPEAIFVKVQIEINELVKILDERRNIESFRNMRFKCDSCILGFTNHNRLLEHNKNFHNQNRNCETLSNLSTILIGEYNKSEEDEREKLSRVEECAQGIKEETVEVEQEETSMPDPLEFNQEDRKAGWDSENLEIQNEPKQKAMKRTKPELEIARDVPKRAKLGQTVTSGPKRLELDQSSPKTSKEQENNPKFTADTDPEAIFVKVQIEINELVKILDERRNIESFRNMRFKCDSCILGFTNHNRLLEHNKNFHNQEYGSCECAICERRFEDDRRLSAHYRSHFVKFVCRLCNYECYTKTGQAIHFKRHQGFLLADTALLKPRKTYQRASARESSRAPST